MRVIDRKQQKNSFDLELVHY